MPRRNSVNPFDFFSPQVLSNRRFYLDLGRRRASRLTVVAGGFETCSEAYVVERRAFPYFALEFVAGGEGEVELSGALHPLAQGAVFSYGPTVPHRIRSASNPLQKYFITFHGRSARQLLKDAGLAPGTCRRVGRPAEFRSVWDEVLHLGSSADSGREGRAALGLRFLLTLVAERTAPELAPTRARQTLSRAEAYLQQHYMKIHRLQEVAAACHVDLPYLCRLSRRFLGQTLFQYLQRLKMHWAAERLQNDCLVREVADELGLDPFQFSRTFKRVHGLSPRPFQKLYGLRNRRTEP